MRLKGRNRASAPWFLNMIAVKRRSLKKSSIWTSERFIPAHNRSWNTYSMRPDEFCPNRKLKGGNWSTTYDTYLANTYIGSPCWLEVEKGDPDYCRYIKPIKWKSIEPPSN